MINQLFLPGLEKSRLSMKVHSHIFRHDFPDKVSSDADIRVIKNSITARRLNRLPLFSFIFSIVGNFTAVDFEKLIYRNYVIRISRYVSSSCLSSCRTENHAIARDFTRKIRHVNRKVSRISTRLMDIVIRR
jgi:hypothetical protein